MDNDLVSIELPTEEYIFEEFLMAEGVLQQHVQKTQGGNSYFNANGKTDVKRFLEQRDVTVKYIRNIIRRLNAKFH